MAQAKTPRFIRVVVCSSPNRQVCAIFYLESSHVAGFEIRKDPESYEYWVLTDLPGVGCNPGERLHVTCEEFKRVAELVGCRVDLSTDESCIED